jgi:hypothetical protein
MEPGYYGPSERLAPTPWYGTVPQMKFMGCQLDAYAANLQCQETDLSHG